MWIDIASGGLLLLHLLVLHPTLNRELQISVGPDLNRERQISVGTAGPQLRPRISVGTGRRHKRQILVGTATPLSNGGGPSQLVRAFADLSRSFREAFADFRVTSIEM